MATKEAKNPNIDTLFEVGAHYGYSRSRRHPSTDRFVLGTKNKTEIIDLEKTSECLEGAKEIASSLAEKGKSILFVGTKPEAREIVEEKAQSIGVPYVANRWVGGTLTNFKEIRKRIARLEKLLSQREQGELAVFTKHEQLLVDREIGDLQKDFGGIAQLTELPAALFIVDPRAEDLAIKEARAKNIPVIALASTDCDVSKVDYPIPANDNAIPSITYFVSEIAEAIRKGQGKQETPKEEKKEE